MATTLEVIHRSNVQPLMLSYEEWVARHPSTRSWPEDRRRREYAEFVATQQRVKQGMEDLRQQTVTYQAAYAESAKNQIAAGATQLRAFTQAVSQVKELRLLVNLWRKSEGRPTFDGTASLRLNPKAKYLPQETALWTQMFAWAAKQYGGEAGGKRRTKYTVALNEYHRVTDEITAAYRASMITEPAAALEKTRRWAPNVFARLGTATQARGRLEQEFYDQTLAQANADALAEGRARPAGTAAGAPGGAAGTAAAGPGGYSWATILVVLVVLGLVGYGIYYAVTEM